MPRLLIKFSWWARRPARYHPSLQYLSSPWIVLRDTIPLWADSLVRRDVILIGQRAPLAQHLSAVPFIALDCLYQVQPSERENHASLPLRPHRPSASSVSPLSLHLVLDLSFSLSLPLSLFSDNCDTNCCYRVPCARLLSRDMVRQIVVTGYRDRLSLQDIV